MISVSRLYLGMRETADGLRYGAPSSAGESAAMAPSSPHRRPVVVWNVTRACNLRCKHCYAQASVAAGGGELSFDSGRRLIEDLAAYGAPVLLFSGGEPLMRRDCLDLIEYAVNHGLRVSLSTNGTLIDASTAVRLKATGVAYVGVSLDGMQEAHDRFRGVAGCFEATLAGVRACRQAGLKVGFRFTMTRENVRDVPAVLDLMEAERIPRICFYHFVGAGRGAGAGELAPSHAEIRRVLDRIVDRAKEAQGRGLVREILTVDNHADGPYLYLRMLREHHPDAQHVWELLKVNGGNSSACGIGCVSWDGTVYADQFLRHRALGNVTSRPFSEIWEDLSNPLMAMLKDKKRHVKGRCADCRFLDVCGGNLRARAEAVTGDLWASDPACYLTDEEIGRVARGRKEVPHAA